MHILMIVLGALATVGIWYFRIRGPVQTIDDVTDTAGRVRGAYKRRKFRKQAEGSALGGLDDPGLAAAVFLVSLGEAGHGLSDRQEAEIASWMADVVGYHDPAEAITFGKWIVREVPDVNEVVRRLFPLWRRALDGGQRTALLAEANRVASMDNAPEPAQVDAIRRLRERLDV